MEEGIHALSQCHHAKVRSRALVAGHYDTNGREQTRTVAKESVLLQ